MNRIIGGFCLAWLAGASFAAEIEVAQADGKPFLYDGRLPKSAPTPFEMIPSAGDVQAFKVRIREMFESVRGVPTTDLGDKRIQYLYDAAPHELQIRDDWYSANIAKDEEAGFMSLFNGENLEGWEGDTAGYAVENGVMVCKPGGNIYTSESFKNFVFRFDFKLPPAGNNGLGIFMQPGDKDGAFDAIELQILDDGHEKYKDIQPYQAHGSVYGIAPAKRGFLKPVGEWNSEEVIVKNRHITVILNGETIVDVNLDEALKDGPMDHREHPGALRNEGRIGFLGHGDVVEFKNMRVKPLPDSDEAKG